MPDYYSTDFLLSVVRSLKGSQTALMSLGFPSMIEDTSEEIHFDVQVGKRRIAPYVNPLVEGTFIESLGFETKTFKPPYVKPKRVFDVKRPLKRMMGEPLTGTMSPAARVQAQLALDMADDLEMIRRLKEVQASEALRVGQVTVIGEGVSAVVNFGRDAGQTSTLASTARWDDGTGSLGTAASPVSDLEDWALATLQLEGAVITDVVMDIKAWRQFRKDPDFEKAVDLRRAGTFSAEFLSTMRDIGLSFQGTLPNGQALWVYQDWYVNAAGTEVPMIPDLTVIGLSRTQLEGIQYHGAILDHDLGFIPGESVPKSWTVPDPSVRYLMSQSAPLVVPKRPNASYCRTVG